MQITVAVALITISYLPILSALHRQPTSVFKICCTLWGSGVYLLLLHYLAKETALQRHSMFWIQQMTVSFDAAKTALLLDDAESYNQAVCAFNTDYTRWRKEYLKPAQQLSIFSPITKHLHGHTPKTKT